MTVAVYDQGVGIPMTLPRSTKWQRVRGWLKNAAVTTNDDAEMIAAAMEVGRTSVATDGRGAGLAQYLDFVDHSDAGHLRIISNSGEILYRRGEPIIQKKRHLLALGGTLVEWDIVRTAKVEA